MTADLREFRRSPLQGVTARFDAAAVTGERGVRLRELALSTMVGIRAEPGGPGYRRIGSALGLDLPLVCGQTAQSDGDQRHTALWLGPDEWLVVSTPASDALLSALTEGVAEERAVVVDLSANRCIVELSGPSARRVLEKGCPVDLHPSAFSAGRAVSTSLGHVPLILWQTDATTYRLLPRTSYAEYLARWLLDAMTEFAGPEVA